MKIKFLTLNVFKGKCLDEVISFINEEQFDIVQMQEVAGGSVSFPKIDCFAEIQKRTGLQGELLTSWNQLGDSKSYFGNATFYNPSFRLKERNELRFKPFQEIDYHNNTPPPAEHPKSALFLRFEHESKTFWCVNTHLAWGPTPLDEPYKVKDAKLLASKLTTLDAPFILSGDFNVISETEVIKQLEPLGRNLTREYALSNTLDFAIHRAKHLFPPGLAVDYIFIHPSIQEAHFSAINTRTLSDHIGLMAEFSLN